MKKQKKAKKKTKKKTSSAKKKSSKTAKRKKTAKRTSGKTAKKKTQRKKRTATRKKAPAKSSLAAEASLEEIGTITHYFPHVDAAVIKLMRSSLVEGDKIMIKGHTTDFDQVVKSMQLDHTPIVRASSGQEIGLRVKAKVRQHDVVYKAVS